MGLMNKHQPFLILVKFYIILNMLKSRFKNPICIILWRDAFYVFTKNIPKYPPPFQLTAGFIIDSNDKFTNIAMNVNYNLKTGTLWPVDGFLIPKGVIIEFRRIGNLNEQS